MLAPLSRSRPAVSRLPSSRAIRRGDRPARFTVFTSTPALTQVTVNRISARVTEGGEGARIQVALQQGDTQGGPTCQVHRVHVQPRPNTGHRGVKKRTLEEGGQQVLMMEGVKKYAWKGVKRQKVCLRRGRQVHLLSKTLPQSLLRSQASVGCPASFSAYDPSLLPTLGYYEFVLHYFRDIRYLAIFHALALLCHGASTVYWRKSQLT